MLIELNSINSESFEKDEIADLAKSDGNKPKNRVSSHDPTKVTIHQTKFQNMENEILKQHDMNHTKNSKDGGKYLQELENVGRMRSIEETYDEQPRNRK